MSNPQPSPSSASSLTSQLYHPTPPPLSAILENIIPSVALKTHFSRGLQSVSPLVQHCTALALTKCLMKYDQVLEWFKKVEAALEEDEGAGTGFGIDDSAVGGGQWSRRRKEVEREIRKRVPEFQVVVAIGQHTATANATLITSTTTSPKKSPNETQNALLAESSIRLLWLYNRCFPSLVAEARFDVGKLLHHLIPESKSAEDDSADDSVRGSSSIAGVGTLRQLHVLRLLKESESFSWSGKTGTSSPPIPYDPEPQIVLHSRLPHPFLHPAQNLQHLPQPSHPFGH